jgi:hypothetical protein
MMLARISRYITVDTKNRWPGGRVVISPRSVREIDWANRLMHLDVDRQKVKGSPVSESDIMRRSHATRDDEEPTTR